MRLLVIQPALPSYRLDFFRRLSAKYLERFRVYYSSSSMGLLSRPVDEKWASQIGGIRSIGLGFFWQSGVISIPLESKDILVLSGNPRQVSTLLLLVKAKLVGAKVVWWGHYWSSSSKRWRQILRFLPMNLADALLFYTDVEIKKFSSDPLALGKRKILASLNNGINFSPIEKCRDKYIACQRDRSYLFIGRLTKKANLDLTLKALARLGDIAPELHVIGDGEESNSLKTLCASLGVCKKIHWHGALTNEQKIAAIANKCRAFHYPGEVGLSLIHGMAYGLPALVHDRESLHMPEIAAFSDGETGECFSYRNEISLASKLIDFLEAGSRLNSMHRKTVSVINKGFTTEDMCRRFVELMEKL